MNMKKIFLLFFLMNTPGLFSQEAPMGIISYGFTKHDEERTKKFWRSGNHYNLRMRIKSTDLGGIYAELGYMNFELTKYWLRDFDNYYNQEWYVKTPKKRIIKIGLAAVFVKQMRWMELNAFFGIGKLYEKDPGSELYYETGPFIVRPSSKNQMYYVDGSIGINFKASTFLGFGVNSGYLISIHEMPIKTFWFPVNLDAKIYF